MTDPGSEVPEADAPDEQPGARPGEAGSPSLSGHGEADEADVLEQQIDVPLDDDDLRS